LEKKEPFKKGRKENLEVLLFKIEEDVSVFDFVFACIYHINERRQSTNAKLYSDNQYNVDVCLQFYF